MAFCIECGISLPEGARFCPACGKAVAQPAEVPVVEDAPVVEETAVVEEVPVVEETPVIEERVIEAYVLEAPVADVCAEPEQKDVLEENVYAVEYTEPVCESEVAEEAVCTENVYEETPAEAPVAVPYAIPAASQSDTYTAASTKEEQQACLDNIYARLKNERLCWKIFGFALMGYAVLFSILGIFQPILFLYVALLYLPVSIISFKMIAKVDFYMNSLYTDCEETVKRCSSVGMIVFGALFNTVAMIFIIINFVNVKNNEKILKEIKYNQDVYNNRI